MRQAHKKPTWRSESPERKRRRKTIDESHDREATEPSAGARREAREDH